MSKGMYRPVFNADHAVWTAEGGYDRGHVPGRRKRRRHTVRPLILMLFFAGVPVHAGTLAPNTLPAGLTVTAGANTTINAPVVNPANVAGQLLQVQQGALKAILTASSFNIGTASEMRIDSTTGAPISTLIRSTGAKSIIEGALTSLNGDVYVISPNGILFGNGARVNVHGLVASALDIRDSDFLNDLGHLYPITDTSDSGYPSGRPAYIWGGDAAGFSTVLVQVEPDARIKAGLGGSVMLFAPKVLNQGSIVTSEGQAVLAAGSKVYLSFAPDPNTDPTTGLRLGGNFNYPADSPYRALAGVLVEVDPYTRQASDAADAPAEITGAAINDTMGRILAERGNITMASFLVNQSGRITATTSVSQKGSIRLLARDSNVSSSANVVSAGGDTHTLPFNVGSARNGDLVFGQDSVTAILLEGDAGIALANQHLGSAQPGEPVPQSGEQDYLASVQAALKETGETLTDAQTFNPPTLEATGQNVKVLDNAKIVAPGGNIALTAVSTIGVENANPAPVELYIGKNTLIDASGLKNVQMTMDSNFMEVLLTLNDLKDDPLNKNGFLSHKKVWVDLRNLPDIQVADLTGYLQQVPHSISEKLATAGTVNLWSDGALVQRASSVVDVSGGSLQYSSGTRKESWIVDASGKAYALSSAPAGVVFTGFLDNNKADGINALLTQEGGYTEGLSAGKVTVSAPRLALDGSFRGGAVYGGHQRSSANLGGSFILSVSDQNADLQLTSTPALLADSFIADEPLPASRTGTVTLNTGMLNRSGFEKIALTGTNGISVADPLYLADGAALSLTGLSIDINGDIVTRGGSLSLKTRLNTWNPDDYTGATITMNGAKLDTSGQWINDYLTGVAGSGRLLTKGGSISINAAGSVSADAGSVLDVSGGGWVQAGGKVKAADAGSLSVAGLVNQNIAQAMRSYALGRGGSLTLNTTSLSIGNNGSGFIATPEFFQSGGFTRYDLSAASINENDGAQVKVQAKNFVLNPAAYTQASGSHVADFAQVTMLPEQLRSSTSLSLNSGSALTIGAGSLLQVEAGGSTFSSAADALAPSISLTATEGLLKVDGTMQAGGGRINLTMDGNPSAGTDSGYDAAEAIWLGSDARLLAAGSLQPVIDGTGLRKGTLLDGGNISIIAKKGYVVAEKGSLLDAGGAQATLDILTSTGYRATPLSSNGGNIKVDAREGMLLDATYNAATPGALGGSLELRLGRGLQTSVDITSTYPGTPQNNPGQQWFLELAQSGSFVPANLHAGSNLQIPAGGLAKIAVDNIMAGGFSDVALKSEYGVRFNGDISLSTSRSLTLDAPLITASSGAKVVLVSSDVMVSNIDTSMRAANKFVAPTPSAGSANLSAIGQLIDLRGQFALSGFSQASYASSGDIRLTGFSNDAAVSPAGMLRTTGELDMTARQVYPTSLSAFTLVVNGAGGKAAFHGTGKHDTVLSAGGSLTVNAETIEQGGVLLAPFGTIALDAGQNLLLKDDSLTSVSANGALIPFGYTSRDGLDYLYDFGLGSQAITAPPERVVKLDAPNVTQAAGSIVDISGGGDLYAYEWVPGTGGSADVLANGAKQNAFSVAGSSASNTWAIMPNSNSIYGSYDTQYWNGSSIQAGDAVYLSGAPGLAAGYYTLLPPRYALLPGAMLVTAVSGHQDMLAGQELTQADGNKLVSGHLAAYTSTGYVSTSRTGGFVVRAGSDARKLAEYSDTLAGTRYANDNNAMKTVDAGRFTVSATSNLILNGVLQALHDQTGRGAEVDVAAPRLLVVDHGATVGSVSLDGKSYLAVDENTLAGMHAASLLLGGARSNGVIDVEASEVRLADNAEVSGPEVILAATDTVRLQSGANVTGNGSGAPARDLTIGSGSVDGDGALLRVAGGDAIKLTRNNTNRDRGDLVIDSGATVLAGTMQEDPLNKNNEILVGGTVRLDGTRGMSVAGALKFGEGAALTVAAGRISLGSPDGGAQITDGLWLKQGQLDPLAQAGILALQSYSTIDLYGAVNVGNANLDLTLQGAGVSGYQNAGQTATITAQTFTLANDGGAAFAAAPALSDGSVPAPGSGTLDVQAQTIVIGGDYDMQVTGFSQTGLNASTEIVAQGSGTFSADHDMTLGATRVTAQSGANKTLQTDGALTLQGTAAIQPPLAAVQAQGAKLTLSGVSVHLAGETTHGDGTVDRHGAVIEMPGGQVTLETTGAGATDNVTLENGSGILVQGSTYTLFDRSAAMPSGKVTLVSDHGSVDMQSGAVIDLSPATGGNAGTLGVSAVNGNASLAGMVHGGTQATATVDAGGINDFSQMLGTLREFSGSQFYRVRNGDVAIAAADSVATGNFVLAADTGAITVSGRIDASGDKGGSIELYAKNDLTVNRGAQLLARGWAAKQSAAGTTGNGGSVVLSSDSGLVTAVSDDLNGVAGALIDVSGNQTGSINGQGGNVVLRASSTYTDNSSFNPVSATVSGTNISANVSGFVLAKGAVAAFTAGNDAAANAKLNVSGTGAKSLMKNGGTAVSSADIQQGKLYVAVYDGTGYQLVSADIPANGSNPVASGVNVASETTGAIAGASQVSIEAVRSYDTSTDTLIATANTVGSRYETLLATDARAFSSLAPSIASGFAQTRDGKTATVVAGVDVLASDNSLGALTISEDWNLGNLTNSGVLTLRSAGDVSVEGNLNYEQYIVGNIPTQLSGTWNYRLTAGADMNSANPKSVIIGNGSVNVADGKLIRTGTGFIDIAAGQGITLGTGSAIYTEGLPSNVTPAGFSFLASNFSLYRELYGAGGGNIRLTANGNISGQAEDTQTVTTWLARAALKPTPANPQLRWWSRYDLFANGVGTLGGGDLTVTAGGDVSNLQLVAASNGRMAGSTAQAPDAANLSIQGGGDVDVHAGGNVLNALLFAGKGEAKAVAGGTLGAQFALMDGTALAMAGGDVTITSVSNPTSLAASGILNGNSSSSVLRTYYYSYGQSAGIHVLSGNGNVDLSSPAVYPANLVTVAPNGDIATHSLTLYPSATGNLTLIAGHDVNPSLVMSDYNPAVIPQVSSVPGAIPDLALNAGSVAHTPGLLHLGDSQPVRFYAGNDVIFAPLDQVVFPKSVQISAGNDVVNPNLIVQNSNSTDVSLISAGNNIRYVDPRLSPDGSVLATEAGIQVAGLGRLHLMAGKDIDLGSSDGVRSVGNLYNPYLPAQGADIMVMPGTAGGTDYAAMIAAYLDPATAGAFADTYLPQLASYMDTRSGVAGLSDSEALTQFKALTAFQQAQFINTVFFAELRSSGRDAIDTTSSSIGDYTRAERAILRMFPNFSTNPDLFSQAGSLMSAFQGISGEPVSNPGDLKLFYSQIRSESGGDIEILVPGGIINAGLAVSGSLQKPATDLGIVSIRGGDVDAMVRGNFQVNQSRVFTLGGSDLMLYSALADIDAGRGAKTSSATPPPVLRIKNGQVYYDYSGAVSGSGIAALTATGGKPGTVDLFAPYGEINAGEAGVRSAGNINLGAHVIVGADNITAGGVTAGVPSADTSGLSMSVGGLTDAANTGRSGDQMAQAANLNSENQDSILPAFISVEVIGLGNDEQDENRDKEKEKDKEKGV